MSWFKVDDCFHCHPKVLAAGNEAVGLYVRCGAYSAQHLTDGYVPRTIALLYGTVALTEILVTVRLWTVTTDGFNIHDYLLYNRSRSEIMLERTQSSERQRQSRERKVAKQRKQNNADVCHSVSHSVTDNVGHSVSHGAVTASRPVSTSTKEHSIIVGTPTNSSAAADGAFDEFWTSYPRRVQKQEALKAWGQQLKKKIGTDRMIAGAKGYAAECQKRNTDTQFIKHPASWLRAGGYDDYQPDPVDERDPRQLLRDLWKSADAAAVAEILRIPFVDCGQPPSDSTPHDRWKLETRRKWIIEHSAEALRALEKPAESNGYHLTPAVPSTSLPLADGGQ